MNLSCSVSPLRARLLAGAALSCIVPTLFAQPAVAADAAPPAPQLAPEVVVSANRVETPVDQVGSAVTVVKGEEIERRGKLSLIDALAGVPGVSFTRTGGVGATTQIKLRGGTSGQTQVLVDGVQLNDGASTDNSFDFDTLLTSGIDRIEVLRGPQSALYGADAMTGVVNIITKRGRGPLKAGLQTEVGSFNTGRGAAAVSGGGERFGGALSGTWQRSDGISRVSRTKEKDGFNQRGLNGSFSADLTDIWTVDVAGGLFDGRSDYDASGADALYKSKKTLRYGKIDNTVTLLDGRLENVLSLSSVATDRSYDEPKGFIPHTNYAATRDVAEYRANLKLREADVLSLGAAHKQESAKVVSTYAKTRSTDIDRGVDTNSFFGQYLLAVANNFHLTLGARHDNNEDFGANTTYRVAGAYQIVETGTTLRASFGTGAKAPTLYQLYAPIYGNAKLTVEKSVGGDAGVEQAFLGGALVGSATAFWNRFDNLINFENSTYVNVGKAHTEGVELAARWAVAANLAAKASYTYTLAENDSTSRWLARRPRHTAALSADWSPVENLNIGGALRLYGEQLDSTFSNRINNAFTVADIDAAYALNSNISVYGRVENLFNANYEEVRGFNTPGRAFYTGLKLKL